MTFEEYLPSPNEVGVSIQKESEREIKKNAREEAKKRKNQETLVVKTSEKETNPFEAKDQFDFDIEKLKAKMEGL